MRDVNENPGPVSKRNQARSTAPTCPVCEKAVAKNQRRFVCWMCHDMTHVKCSSFTADSRVFSASSPVSWTCNRCAFASLPIFEESSSDDFNALTFSSDESSKARQLIELSAILIKYSKNLKIGHININSVAGFKFFELKSLILKSLFDIIVISECKVEPSFPDSHFYIKGFRLYRKDRDRFGGGGFIYVRRGLIVTRIHDLEGHEVESVSLCVQTSRRAKKVLVIGMYRPPGLLKATWEHEINNILLRSTQRVRYESIMLIGDLNCDLSRPDKGAKEGKTLIDLMDVYGLTNLIKVPTRVVVESSSLTDVILTNKPRSVLTSGVFDLGLSDHNLIYTVMRLQCPKFSPRTVVKRHFKHYDPGLFSADIATILFHVAHIFDDPEDVCWAWGKLLSDALDVHAPVKRYISKHQHVPFMTTELLGSIRDRNKLRKLYLSPGILGTGRNTGYSVILLHP